MVNYTFKENWGIPVVQTRETRKRIEEAKRGMGRFMIPVVQTRETRERREEAEKIRTCRDECRAAHRECVSKCSSARVLSPRQWL